MIWVVSALAWGGNSRSHRWAVLAAARCADTVPHDPTRTGEAERIAALDLAKRYGDGEDIQEADLYRAANAADAAAQSIKDDGAVNAPKTAARAASSAARGDAICAVYEAVSCGTYKGASIDAALRQMADIIRETIPMPEFPEGEER